MKSKLVLDASALLAGVRAEGEECFTIPEVVEEIKEQKARLSVDLSISAGALKLLEPGREALDKARAEAARTGDIAHLSPTDVKLIALALDLKEKSEEAVILTDDYSIQNISKGMGIPFLPVAETGIKRYLTWKNICKGCGKRFPIDYKGKCDHCGSEVVRKAKRRRK